MALTTPVAFFVFNRPEPTRTVFAAIAAARPRVLLLVADGARADRHGEAERVAEVRSIVSSVDWPCEVFTDFSETNLGCKQRISSGIDWVFSKVERAIILEDDCCPSPAFFRFAQDMLERYASDRRIYSISGSNFSGSTTPSGHYFSNFALMWGWATWRDRWADYEVDPEMPSEILRRMWWNRPIAYLYWKRIYTELTSGRIDTWDYQWLLTLWRKGALTVRPSVNLVQNIGFGPDATHTMNSEDQMAMMTAWDGDGGLEEPPGAVQVDNTRDMIDERVWARINWKSILLMRFPWLARLK